MKKQINEIIHYNSYKALHIRVKSTLTQSMATVITYC